jgi:hypothetical protein
LRASQSAEFEVYLAALQKEVIGKPGDTYELKRGWLRAPNGLADARWPGFFGFAQSERISRSAGHRRGLC